MSISKTTIFEFNGVSADRFVILLTDIIQWVDGKFSAGHEQLPRCLLLDQLAAQYDAMGIICAMTDEWQQAEQAETAAQQMAYIRDRARVLGHSILLFASEGITAWTVAIAERDAGVTVTVIKGDVLSVLQQQYYDLFVGALGDVGQPEQPGQAEERQKIRRGPRRFSVDEQLDIAQRYLSVADRVTQEDFSAQYSISVRTLQRYVDQYQQRGTT